MHFSFINTLILGNCCCWPKREHANLPSRTFHGLFVSLDCSDQHVASCLRLLDSHFLQGDPSVWQSRAPLQYNSIRKETFHIWEVPWASAAWPWSVVLTPEHSSYANTRQVSPDCAHCTEQPHLLRLAGAPSDSPFITQFWRNPWEYLNKFAVKFHLHFSRAQDSGLYVAGRVSFPLGLSMGNASFFIVWS